MTDESPETSPETSPEKELNDTLKSLEKIMESLQDTLQPMKAQMDACTKEEKIAYEAYTQAVAKSRAKKKILEEQNYKIQTELNKAKMQAAEVRRKQESIRLEQEKRELERLNKERADALTLRWDKLTAGAPWREWAKDHQIKAGHFITQKRKVILADPMGLGKTLSSVIVCDMAEALTRHASLDEPVLGTLGKKNVWDTETNQYLKVDAVIDGIERPVGRKVVYFCPASLVRNVMKEFRMWAKHRNVIYLSGMTKVERAFAFEYMLKDAEDYVLIVNYEAWRKDPNFIDNIINLLPDTIIIDEAHNIKDTKSIAYRGIKRILDTVGPEYVIPMTGTPILNRPQELFSLLTLVNPERFYHLNSFLQNFCEQDDAGFWKFQPGGLDRVAIQIRDNFLRRTKEQAGIILPEKTIIHHDLEVDSEKYRLQAEARDQMRNYATIMIGDDESKAVTAAAIIAVFTRLRQIETWPAGIEIKDTKTGEVKFHLEVEESQKVDYVISKYPDSEGSFTGIIPEVIEEERVVLFSQFRAPLLEIKSRIEKAGYSACILDGTTSAEEREFINNDFDRRYTPDRSQAKYDVVLCNYKVGGVGLNLTAATQLVVLDEEWNPGKRDQAYDRIHRIGQTDPVTIHVIRNQKTIDDWLAGIMEAKEGMVEGFNTTMISAAEFKNALDNGLL